MPGLTDEAATELIRLLELKGFTRWRDSDDVVVLVNAEVCKHPIPVRLNSPMTDELARRLLKRAGISEGRIAQFIVKYSIPAKEKLSASGEQSAPAPGVYGAEAPGSPRPPEDD